MRNKGRGFMLTSEKVNTIFKDCLFYKSEIIDGKPIVEPVIAEGIRCAYGFNPERVNGYSNEIGELIDELPLTFREGWSFLNMCHDKDERLWTGSHETMEQLLVLGLATKKLSYCFERKMWSDLPGGMPYILIN